MLFLTENFAALEILKHFIHDTLRTSLSDRDGEVENTEPFVLFGSSFPKDRTFTQVHMCTHLQNTLLLVKRGLWHVILMDMQAKAAPSLVKYPDITSNLDFPIYVMATLVVYFLALGL